MKSVALVALMLAILPAMAFADGKRDRGDRYDRGSRSHRYDDGGGRKHYDKGDRYQSRGHSNKGHHRSSSSSFSFGFGFSSNDWYGDNYSFGFGYSNRPVYRERVVYVEPAPVYYAPPPVVYVPAPRVYYTQPCYTPTYHFSSRYYYRR